jgi:hypothetical protein
LTRRKGEITARMNERDCPHIVELPLPSGGFRSKSDASEASNLAEVAAGMTMSNTTSASASLIRRTPTPSANGLVERG